jgi:hypothetical protein
MRNLSLWLPSTPDALLRELSSEFSLISLMSSEFIKLGIDSTKLLDRRHKDIKLYDREESIRNIQMVVFSSVRISVAKMPIICIPAGPGYGKSELAARLLEDWDRLYESFYAIYAGEEESGSWLPCAVTFNYQTDITPFEVEHSLSLVSMVCLRLIFIWLIDKGLCHSYLSFLDQLVDVYGDHTSRWVHSLSLQQIVSTLQMQSNTVNVMLIVDESLRPVQHLHPKNEELQRLAIAQLAQQQTANFVIVFTNVRHDPFGDPLRTQSGRDIVQIPLRKISSTSTRRLIEDMVKIRGKGDLDSQLLDLLASWSGGRPRLCEFAAMYVGGVKQPHPTIIIDRMVHALMVKYAGLKIPREIVVLALLGYKLPPGIECSIPSSIPSRRTSVDALIADGVISRERDNEIFQPALLLKVFCNQVLPLMSASEAALGSSSSSSSSAARRREPSVSVELQLAIELDNLLDCTFPSGDGKQFEKLDRLRFRVWRTARHQYEADVRDKNIRLQESGTDCKVELEQHEGGLQARSFFDPRNASLEEVFGPFAESTISAALADARFDISSPFQLPDIPFDDIPRPTEVSLERQYFPKNNANEGFDWFVVLQSSDGQLVAVASENKFSAEESCTTISNTKDVLKKSEQTFEAFEKAGWQREQVVYRLGAYRKCPDFKVSTVGSWHFNVVVCGPEQLKESFSLTLQGVFDIMRDIDALK